MKIIFSDHALIKISQRHLSKNRIIATIENPSLMKPSYNLREERYKHFGKNWLKVVVIHEQELIIVITAHWVAKVQQYWQYDTMKITYDKKVDALALEFKAGKVERTLEIAPEILLDVDRNGAPLYLEIIGASEKIGPKNFSTISVGKKSFRLSAAI